MRTSSYTEPNRKVSKAECQLAAEKRSVGMCRLRVFSAGPAGWLAGIRLTAERRDAQQLLVAPGGSVSWQGRLERLGLVFVGGSSCGRAGDGRGRCRHCLCAAHSAHSLSCRSLERKENECVNFQDWCCRGWLGCSPPTLEVYSHQIKYWFIYKPPSLCVRRASQEGSEGNFMILYFLFLGDIITQQQQLRWPTRRCSRRATPMATCQWVPSRSPCVCGP